MMSVSVISWWSMLCVVSALNVGLWSLAAVSLARRRLPMSSDTYALRRLQLMLSAVYVFGCAFRAAVPVYDIPRICMIDSWVSNVMLGRSVATVAELCFVAQWVLMLRQAARATRSRFAAAASLTVLPLIVLAEICSWYSVLTTSNLGHIAEESIWGLSAGLMVASMVVIVPQFTLTLRRLFNVACIVGIAYVTYMFLVDVPLYWSRWMLDERGVHHYLSIAQGLVDVRSRWIVSYSWADWKNEVIWKSLYFSVAVWLSILLVHAPIARIRPVAETRRRLLSAPA
jgi:hypothetical protein